MNQYHSIQAFFKTYAWQFTRTSDKTEPFKLKIQHTERVCNNAQSLCNALDWKSADTFMALTAALLHDIGRFEQFKVYQTFSDSKSENHAALGVKVIQQNNILSELTPSCSQQIIQAVAHHNALHIPKDLDQNTKKLAKLIRDADKIDIFKVMADLYVDKIPDKTSFITHYLRDDKKLNAKRTQEVLAQQLVDLKHVKTLNDMKLFQISWIFDLNYSISLGIIRERGHVAQILSSLPPSKEKDQIQHLILDILNSKNKYN